MNPVRTVSDAKQTFYSLHTRPINSVYRRVVEELMVEMHLLSVNANFRYDPIYATGVVTTFDRFMDGYRPESDIEAIFIALCTSIHADPHQYRRDSSRWLNLAQQHSIGDMQEWLSLSRHLDDGADLQGSLQAIADSPSFKYSRLFAIGLFTLLETANPEAVKDDKFLMETIAPISEALHFSIEKLQKDLELYKSNLEKVTQAKLLVQETIEADRKKREQRQQEKGKIASSSEEA